jgi:hypothetical protein
MALEGMSHSRKDARHLNRPSAGSVAGPQCRAGVFMRRIQPRPFDALLGRQLLNNPPEQVVKLSPLSLDAAIPDDLTTIPKVK